MRTWRASCHSLNTWLTRMAVVGLTTATPASAQQVTAFTLEAVTGDGTNATNLTSGFDGNVWYTFLRRPESQPTEFGVGRIAAAGTSQTLLTQGLGRTINASTAIVSTGDAIYAAANRGIWEVLADGTTTLVAEMDYAVADLVWDDARQFLWVTGRTGIVGGKVGRFDLVACEGPSRLCFLDAEDPVPFTVPGSLVIDADGNVWYVDSGNPRLVRVTPTFEFESLQLPNFHRGFDIATGADGNLWFTEPSFASIGRLTTESELSEFPVSHPVERIAAGPDQALYATRPQDSGLRRIALDGSVTTFDVALGLQAVTAGPDGNIWAADGVGLIYRFEPPSVCTGDCNRGLSVTVDELITGVSIALGALPLSECDALDCNGTGTVTVDCLVTAINAALQGCG